MTANALMPEYIIRNIPPNIVENSAEIFKVVRKLGVSSFAFLVRALNLNLISLISYKKLKNEADAEYKAFLKREEDKKAKQKESVGGPSPYLLKLNRNSKLFTQAVLDAFRGGFIEPTQASKLLNTQVNKFSKLEAQLYK